MENLGKVAKQITSLLNGLTIQEVLETLKEVEIIIKKNSKVNVDV